MRRSRLLARLLVVGRQQGVAGSGAAVLLGTPQHLQLVLLVLEARGAAARTQVPQQQHQQQTPRQPSGRAVGAAMLQRGARRQQGLATWSTRQRGRTALMMRPHWRRRRPSPRWVGREEGLLGWSARRGVWVWGGVGVGPVGLECRAGGAWGGGGRGGKG
jgi:hypothetical protein